MYLKILCFLKIFLPSHIHGKKDYLDLSDHEQNLEPTEFTYTQDNNGSLNGQTLLSGSFQLWKGDKMILKEQEFDH